MRERHFWLKETDVVCVTGGGGGLGSELVKAFVNRGCMVAVVDVVTPPVTDQLSTVLYLEADIRDIYALQHCETVIRRKLGTVTVLVNNAAIRRQWAPVSRAPTVDIQAVLDINLVGTFMATKAFLPHMLLRQRGRIVFVSSALGLLSPAGLSAYGAAKAGVIGLYESLAAELPRDSGVLPLLVCPGQIDTGLFADIDTPSALLAPILSPSRLARQITAAVNLGRQSPIYAPLYVNFLPLMRALPRPLVVFLRDVSGMDKAAGSAQTNNASDLESTFPSPFMSNIPTPKSVKSHSPGPHVKIGHLITNMH